MVDLTPDVLPHVQASLNYLVSAGEKPVTYAYPPPPGVPWSSAEVHDHATTIHNLRPAAAEFALDDAGFQLLTHQSAVKNFWDEDEIKRVYYPESVEFLKRVTRAVEVRVFDHTLGAACLEKMIAQRSPTFPPARQSRSCRSDGDLGRDASST